MFSLIASLLVLVIGTPSQRVSLDGVFALQAARSLTQAHLLATQIGTSPLDQHLDLWLTRDRARTVDRYDLEMTKSLHLIAIGDDFATFVHLHPVLGDDHHFRVDVTFPKNGMYHVYADGTPDGIGQQVFRYDLRVGSSARGQRDVAPTGARVASGPYRVSLATTGLRVGTENELAVHITSDGRPASDLHPYLGALAHAVFIDANDLSYAHVHPMPLGMEGAGDANVTHATLGKQATQAKGGMAWMAGMDATRAPLSDSQRSSPDMLLHVFVHRAGTYKLWLQFRGKDGLHAAPFVLTAA